MNIQVHKFGGTCVKSTSSIKILEELISKLIEDNKIIITVSASYGITDKLKGFINKKYSLKNIEKFINELRVHHQGLIPISNISDKINPILKRLKNIFIGQLFSEIKTEKANNLILTFGERLIVIIIFEYFKKFKPLIINPESFIMTTDNYSDSLILIDLTKQKFEKLNTEAKLIIVPGFFGINKNQEICTLGRSGTDYTGAILANIVDATNYTIWKDVNGFMTADPNKIENAFTIDELNYLEAEELSYFGATILHKHTIPALKIKKIPLIIRNLFSPSSFTTIQYSNIIGIKSISYLNNLVLVEIPKMNINNDFLIILNKKSNIELYTINSTNTTLTLLINENEASKIDKIYQVKDYKTINQLSFIAIVGEGKLDIIIISNILKILSDNKINIIQLVYGVNNRLFYLIVNNSQLILCQNILHKYLFE